MKTFLQFQEQVEKAQELALANKKKNSDYTKAQIRAGIRHRAHVHKELAQRQRAEQGIG